MDDRKCTSCDTGEVLAHVIYAEGQGDGTDWVPCPECLGRDLKETIESQASEIERLRRGTPELFAVYEYRSEIMDGGVLVKTEDLGWCGTFRHRTSRQWVPIKDCFDSREAAERAATNQGGG